MANRPGDFDFKKGEAQEKLRELKRQGISAVATRTGRPNTFNVRERLVQEKTRRTGQRKTKKGKLSKLSKVFSGSKKQKKILKKSNVVLKMEHKEIPSVLGDPNRFLKSKYEEDPYDF